MSNQTTIRRSRLARQENKKMAKQTLVIIISAIVFLILFFWVGIPGLINLAVNLGNSKASTKFGNESDTIPPVPPQLEVLPVATSSATIDIKGIAESGSTVYLYQDQSKIQETTADNTGTFAFLNISLTQGSSEFSTQSIDQAGNQSHMSNPQTISFDDQAPELEITSPSDGSSFLGVTEQFIDIAGKTDQDATVFLNDRQLVVTADGTFFTKHELKEGDNTLSFTAIDPANNKTDLEIKVSFSR